MDPSDAREVRLLAQVDLMARLKRARTACKRNHENTWYVKRDGRRECKVCRGDAKHYGRLGLSIRDFD